MIYLAIGAAALWFFVSLGRGRTIFKRREWRLMSGAFAVAAFAGAAWFGLRGGWAVCIVLLVLGLWMAMSARVNGVAAFPLRRSQAMSLDEARSILGVSAEATEEDIQAAYMRLMRLAHPDKGGTSGLAAQLNAARDRLLRK